MSIVVKKFNIVKLILSKSLFDDNISADKILSYYYIGLIL